MSTVASGLKDLHRLHLDLQGIQDKLKRGPVQIKARENIAQKKKSELEAQKEQIINLKKASDGKSLQLKTNEMKIEDLNRKLNSAASNKEFEIFKSQIKADEMSNSVLEDEILEMMEKIDATSKEYVGLEEEYQAAEAEISRFTDNFKSEEPEFDKQTQSLEAAIAEFERTLPGQVKIVYLRLVQAHGAGALALVEKTSCTACNVELAPQSRVELNSGKITFCRSCGRLMYLKG